jgi:anti-sigma B factor antagonist
MDFHLNTVKDASVLKIQGELDAMSVPDLQPALRKIGENRPAKVLIDLSHLRLIDATGVGAIVGLFKTVRAYDGSLAVVGVRDQPLAILRLLNLDRVLARRDRPRG